ncbi:MAG: YjiH family protein [Synergistaceae bacterium]|jgi:nucleoside recognition membrane protein YjiH|nr:YjiH family protein [Synergistaceae bacterium]
MAGNEVQGSSKGLIKFLGYSLFGVFMFFCPVTIGGRSTIPVDHIISFITANWLEGAKIYILILMYCGAALPFIRRTWNKDGMSIFFSLAKVCGAIIGTVLYFKLLPDLAWLWRPDFGPFLFEKLAMPVGLVIPIGSVFLAFLASFGLMEFTGVLMTPIMRPCFRTPGRSAIDAVASFVGSYSIALIITNNMYRQGKYSVREAAIVATGFSTVSATFLLVVARTLNLMEHWTLYFWVSLLVTFVVTAITAYIWPLCSYPNTYFGDKPNPDPDYTGNRFRHAWEAGIQVGEQAEPLAKMTFNNLKAGLNMAFAVIPSITSVGLLGLVLAEYTPLFDWFGYLFYPFFSVFGVSDAALAGKAAAISLPEMFLPALLIAKKATPLLGFVIAVVSISEILFFSASIPCLMGTDIPIKLRDIIVIWFERVVLSIVLTIPLAMMLGFADVVAAAAP